MILNEEEINLLKEVTQLFGPSGDEFLVKEYLKNKYCELGMEIKEDNLGSIIAFKKSKVENAKKIMILAHMDEVGFMVNKIHENGCVSVLPLGSHNYSTLLSNRVVLKNNDGKFIKGTVSAASPHLSNGKEEKSCIENMMIDFGYASKEELLNDNISIGNTLICEGNFEVLNNGKRLLSKAFDDRIGLALGLEILKEFQDKELNFDLYVGGSVQEEVGCRGALTCSHLVHPDLAIVLDCSPANDINTKNELGHLGEGVLIRVKDGNMIAFKDLINYQINLLKENNIKHQYFISNGGTDAGNIHKSFDGIKTLTYCLAARSIHTPSTILDANDYKEAKKGLICLINDINKRLKEC